MKPSLPASCWPLCPDSRSGPHRPLPVSHPGRQQRTGPANRCGLTVSLTGAALLVSSSRKRPWATRAGDHRPPHDLGQRDDRTYRRRRTSQMERAVSPEAVTVH